MRMIAVYKKFLLMLGVTVLLCLSASVVWSEQLNKLNGINLICKCEKECESVNFIENTKNNIKGFSFLNNKIMPHNINFKMDNYIYEHGELTDFYTHPFAIEFGIGKHDSYIIDRKNLFLTITKIGKSNSNLKQRLFKCKKIIDNSIFIKEFSELIKIQQKQFNIITDKNKL